MTRLVTVSLLVIVGLARPSAGQIVIHAKLDTATEHLLIPVTIAGHVFWCGLDSGFSALIALDRSKAVAAGLSSAAGIPTPDGRPPSPGDGSTTATVTVGDVKLANQSIILRRMPDEAPDTDCVMGVAPLRQFIVEFDYVAPRVTLYKRSEYRPVPGTDAVPLIFRANPRVPYVDLQMRLPDGSQLPLRLLPDTGAAFYDAVLVGDAATRARAQLPTVKAITHPEPETGRITQLIAARPPALGFAVTVPNPVIAFVDGSLGNDGSIADGLLGSGFFRRFTVAFDFDGRVMYLRPNGRLSQQHLFDASGLGFIGRQGKHVVFQVLPDSVGADAGVQEGDVLLTLDDVTADELTAAEVRARLSADGARRRLVLERNGTARTFVLQLKKRL